MLLLPARGVNVSTFNPGSGRTSDTRKNYPIPDSTTFQARRVVHVTTPSVARSTCSLRPLSPTTQPPSASTSSPTLLYDPSTRWERVASKTRPETSL